MTFALAGTSTVGLLLTLASGALTGASAAKPIEDGIYFPVATNQSEADEYTRYELLAPESGKFRITYEVTSTTAGARTFYNPIRKGSAASDEAVLDAMTGEPLEAKEMSGAEMAALKINAGEPVDPDARVVVIPFTPVQPGQSLRIRITETYTAPVSYRLDGDELARSARFPQR